MRQEVNLYLPEFRKREDWLDFNNMLWLSVAFVLLLAVVSGFQYWQIFSMGGELAQLNGQKQAAVARTNTLINSFGVQSEDKDLSASVTQLETSLAEKKDLLDFLEGRDLGNTSGFSEFLADLSRYHIPGLRITSVQLSEGGKRVRLGGEVGRAEYVPLFLQNLSQGKAYQGMSFETLKMGEPETRQEDNGILAFEVATRTGAK